MNIYALEGHKVTCSTLDAGYENNKEVATKHLTVGNVYTVDYTNVDSWHTDVYLKEFPDVAFNSIFFEDADEQSDDKDAEHPDYKYFHE